MSYTVSCVLYLPDNAGETLNAQLYNSANTTVGSAITSGFYERAGATGLFAYSLAVPDNWVSGWVDIYVSGTPGVVIASLPINASEYLSTVLMQALADALIGRGSVHMDGTAERDSLYELMAVNMRSRAVSTTLHIYQTDGVTEIGTRPLELDAAALPIKGVGAAA